MSGEGILAGVGWAHWNCVSQGYNDGLTTLPLADYEPRLSPEAAQAAEFDDYELETVTKQIFEEGLGLAGVSLLKQGVQGLVSCPTVICMSTQLLSVSGELLQVTGAVGGPQQHAL